jgi:hypothetical protein
LDVNDFTGRNEELDRLRGMLAQGDAVPVVVISGPPGVGKSALDARATLLRSRLAGRRVLVLLDDAGSVDQVAPLLPGRPGSAVIVTSRSELAGLTVLYGGNRLALRPLSAQHAYELLARIVGEHRCAEDSAGASEVAELCGRLPLALRIAAANLASRPGLGISTYAADLLTGDRLSHLSTRGETGVDVRSAFDSSVDILVEAERRGFCLLGVIPGGDIGADGAAALFGCTAGQARQVLDRLVAANLLECHTADRYRFHDLMRVYAGSRTDEVDRDEALGRLAEWYVHGVHAAVRKSLAAVYISQVGAPPADIAVPVFTTDDEALRWLDVERVNYLAVIEHTATAGPLRYAWQLADLARPDLQYTCRYAEWEQVVEIGLTAARSAGDQRGEAVMRLGRGVLNALTVRYDESIRDHTEARAIAQRIGETGISAAAMVNMAATYDEAGLPELCVRTAEEAGELLTDGVEQAEARWTAVLVQLGQARFVMGDLRQALEIFTAVQGRVIQAEALFGQMIRNVLLGTVYRELGDYGRSLEHFSRALDNQVVRHVVIGGTGVGMAALQYEMGRMDLAYDYAVAHSCARRNPAIGKMPRKQRWYSG